MRISDWSSDVCSSDLVSGWRPYAPASGPAAIVGHSRITDGDRLLSMAFSRFAPAERFEFTIDLHDTLPGTTPPWIDGRETLGSRVHAVITGPGGATAEDGKSPGVGQGVSSGLKQEG